MKRLLIALTLLIHTIGISAQKEQDFASRFMEINGGLYEGLTCNTVSPYMMERIMKLDTLEDNTDIRKILSQLKSIQIVEAKESTLSDSLFCTAQRLARQNEKRYKIYANDAYRQIYLRTRNKIIVEMVFITKINQTFSIVNLTGNMDESFLKELANM